MDRKFNIGKQVKPIYLHIPIQNKIILLKKIKKLGCFGQK